MRMTLSQLDSPLGTLLLATDGQGRLRALELAGRRARLHRNLQAQYGATELTEGPAPAAIAEALRRYLEGEWHALDRLEVATAGSEAQQRAWAALRRIPAGQTATYGAIGQAMGITDWRAAVDAGAAVGANPIALVIPCHRVLGANGDLKGYAWGPQRKRWLLEHEGALAAPSPAPRTASLF